MSAANPFIAGLDAEAAKTGNVYFLGAREIPKAEYSDSDEEDKEPEVNAETQMVVWIDKSFKEECDRISGDCEDMSAEVFSKEIDTCRKSKADMKLKMASALALTKFMTKEPDWMGDDQQKAMACIKQLANLWRTTILKKADKVLGFANPDNRAALYCVLDQAQSDFDIDGSGELFNYKPPEKKSRTKSGN